MLRYVCLCRVALVLNNSLLFTIYSSPSPFSIPVSNLQEYIKHLTFDCQSTREGQLADGGNKQIKAKI